MSTMRRLLPTLLIGAVLAAGLSGYPRALAQTAIERQCLTPGTAGQVEACAALIAAGKGNLAEYHYSRGAALLEKSDCDGALADFDAAVRLRPRDPAYQGGRGLTLYNCKHDFAQAAAAFTEVLRLTPRDAAAFDIRGSARLRIGDIDGAIADQTAAIRLQPNVAMYYGNRAITWTEKGDVQHAIADYNEDIRLAPTADSYNNRGYFWLRQGDADQAIADFTQTIKLDPNFAKAYATRGEAWRQKGDLDRALADMADAIRINPHDPLNFTRRADVLRYRGDYRDALAEYDRALAVMADYIPAFTGRGLAFERLGDLTAARAEFDKAIASRSYLANIDVSRSALDTARARLAALDSGVAPPTIPAAPAKAVSPTSLPTPAAVVPLPSALPKASPTLHERRVALVIGNSAYQNVGALPNPQKDAQALATTLRNIGFDVVTLAQDATRDKLSEALRTFAEESEKADWAMVYYAGHGIEVNGTNYLIPVDAKLATDRDIQFQAVPLDQVMAAVEGAHKLKLIMLDACRDNPFVPAMRRTAAPEASAAPTGGGTVGTRSIGKGLAEVKVSGATLVVYAAKEGQTALDGEGGNSPFAVAVVQRLATPGVEINKLFRLVRDDVMEIGRAHV